MANKQTLFGFEPITSISFSNDEIKNIMLLYDIERFDLDCTYSIGQFWKALPQPKHKTDLLPKRPDIVQARILYRREKSKLYDLLQKHFNWTGNGSKNTLEQLRKAVEVLGLS